MPLSDTVLRDYIVADMQDVTDTISEPTAQDYHDAMSLSLNTHINDDSSASGAAIALSPTGGVGDPFVNMSGQIKTGLAGATAPNPGAPPPTLFLSGLPALTLTPPSPSDDQATALLGLCTGIVNWLVAYGVV